MINDYAFYDEWKTYLGMVHIMQNGNYKVWQHPKRWMFPTFVHIKDKLVWNVDVHIFCAKVWKISWRNV